MNRPVHFDIHADDPERAIRFYEEVFGWKFTKWEAGGEEMEYWLAMTGDKSEPGIDGGLTKRMVPVTNDDIIAYVCTMEVENLDEMTDKVKAFGGKITQPKMEVMKVGWMAMCKDTEGNTFGMIQMMPGAMSNM